MVSELVSPHAEENRNRLGSSADSMVDSEIIGLRRPIPIYWTRYNPNDNQNKTNNDNMIIIAVTILLCLIIRYKLIVQLLMKYPGKMTRNDS